MCARCDVGEKKESPDKKEGRGLAASRVLSAGRAEIIRHAIANLQADAWHPLIQINV